MLKRLLPVLMPLALSACQPEKADLRRLQALTYTLEQANERAVAANQEAREYLTTRLHRLRGQQLQTPVLGQLLGRCDTIRVGAGRLHEQLQKSRRQLSTMAPNAALSPAQRTAATQVLAQLAAYQATLRTLDVRLVPRLVPPQLVGTTAAPALADFYFGDATAAEALAALAQLEATALASEAAAWQAQSLTLACGGNVVFDRVGAWAVARSTTVAAGTEYQADLVLASALSTAGMRMSANGEPIAVTPDGVGRVRFIADARLLGSRQEVITHWDGSIRVKSAYTQSGDTTYKLRVPYRIVRSK